MTVEASWLNAFVFSLTAAVTEATASCKEVISDTSEDITLSLSIISFVSISALGFISTGFWGSTFCLASSDCLIFSCSCFWASSCDNLSFSVSDCRSWDSSWENRSLNFWNSTWRCSNCCWMAVNCSLLYLFFSAIGYFSWRFLKRSAGSTAIAASTNWSNTFFSCWFLWSAKSVNLSSSIASNKFPCAPSFTILSNSKSPPSSCNRLFTKVFIAFVASSWYSSGIVSNPPIAPSLICAP